MAQFGWRGLTSCDLSEGDVCSFAAFYDRQKNACFQVCFFGVFFVELVAKLALKCDKRCHFGTTRVTPCCNMLSFSQPLFLNDPTAFWPYFPMLAEHGIWKNLEQKHLKPIWRHVAKKTRLETSKLKEKQHKNRPQLRSNWAPGPPTNFRYFSPGASMRGHIGAMISHGCHTLPKWCHQCFQGVRKWLQGSKNRAKCSRWGAFL